MNNSVDLCENRERYLFLDIMKFIALILMPCIHIFNMFSTMEFTGNKFLSESVATQFGFIYLIVPGVFMFCMGVALVRTKNQTPKAFALRGLKLYYNAFLTSSNLSVILIF